MKEYIDKNVAETLSGILDVEHVRSLLLITGGASYLKSPLKLFFEHREHPFEITRYPVSAKNPNYDSLLIALDELKSENPDLIIATGGGRVLDFAKLINIFLNNRKALNGRLLDPGKLQCSAAMVMIPTTSGSGSEVTNFVVMYRNGTKHSLVCPQLNIKYVIVDPKLTHTLPPGQTAVSGMDAICQAIESIWAKDATPASRSYAGKAISLLYPNIEKAVHNPDEKSRRSMAIGAYYAGKAINISKTTGPHALSYYLMENLNIPHGEAVAMNMELFIELNFPVLPGPVREQYYELFRVNSMEEFKTAISQLKKRLGLRMGIRDAGIDSEAKIMEYLNHINQERMDNNPRQMDADLLCKNMISCIN